MVNEIIMAIPTHVQLTSFGSNHRRCGHQANLTQHYFILHLQLWNNNIDIQKHEEGTYILELKVTLVYSLCMDANRTARLSRGNDTQNFHCDWLTVLITFSCSQTRHQKTKPNTILARHIQSSRCCRGCSDVTEISDPLRDWSGRKNGYFHFVFTHVHCWLPSA